MTSKRPGAAHAEQALQELARKWKMTPGETSQTVWRLIRILELRIGAPYYVKPGYAWTPARCGRGRWSRSPREWWTKIYLPPQQPAPTYRAFVTAGASAFLKLAPLTPTRITSHLVGPTESVGQQRPSKGRLVVIDLDTNESGAHGASVIDRYRSVLAALGLEKQHAVVRSSTSGGVHIYFRVDRRGRGTEIRRQVEQLLARGGVPTKAGFCEVFPKGSTNLRLPFGAGSRLLRRGTLRAYRAPHAVQVRRFLDQIEASAVQLQVVRAGRGSAPPLSLVRPRTWLGAPGADPKIDGASERRPSSTKKNEPSIAEIMRGITGPGRRNKESFRLLQFLAKQGWDDERIRVFFSDWLEHGEHHSKDFERDANAARRKLLADFPGTLQRIRSFHGTTKPPASSTRYLSLLPYRYVVCTRAGEEGVTVRTYLARYQCRSDERLVASEAPWLRPKLLHLISMLRLAHECNGVLHIALPSAEVSNISGRQRLPEHQQDRRLVGRTKMHVRARAPYRIMLDAAIRLKVISKVKSGVRGAHGDIYKLNPRITEPHMSDESMPVLVPSWKQHEMRVRHVTKYSTSPVWQHAKPPSLEELARGLGGLLADARLSKRQKSAGGPRER